MSLQGLGRALCRNSLTGREWRCELLFRLDYTPDRGHQQLNAHDVHHMGEIVGRHVECHLGGNLEPNASSGSASAPSVFLVQSSAMLTDGVLLAANDSEATAKRKRSREHD